MLCIAAAPFHRDLSNLKHGGKISAVLLASPSTVHLPQIHRLLDRVNIYKFTNVCCGLGSAACCSRGDGAHRELMGANMVSGSIRSSGGFKCHKQPVPDVRHDAMQMN